MLQYCPTVCDPMDYSPPASSLYGISQARILEWVAMPSSRGSSQPKDQSHVSCVSCIAGGFFTHWVIREFKHSNKEIDSYQVKLEKIHCLIWVSLGKGNPQLFEQSYCSTSEKAMAPHSSTLAWKIPWTEEPGGLQSMGLWRVGHDWTTSFSLFTFMHWRRKWQPTPVFLPGESQGRGSLVGCRLWSHTESDTTEAT